MTSTIKVDNIQDQDGNNIINENSNTITIGASGDTVTLASGASQSGFGRTGTVDWDTTPKTANFTAVNGDGFFVNTTSGAITATLPSGSAGAIVAFADYANTWDTNNLTINPQSGEKIGGVAAGSVVSTEGASITFVYVDSTQGWKQVNDATLNTVGNPYIVATGGTITTCGNCKIHTFTGPGTFTVSATGSCATNNIVSHLVVAGGGGSAQDNGGGGGAGGFREVKNPVNPYTASPLDGYPSAPNRVTVTATSYPITVGAGGAGAPPPSGNKGAAGANSIFSTITSAGGGGGGGDDNADSDNGGSGGGGGGRGGSTPPGKGSGNTPPVTPSQGNDGGDGGTPGSPAGGGGGGASAAGSPGSASAPNGAAGGNGSPTAISGSATTYAGGGGGGVGQPSSGTGGSGGSGGGGNGGPNNNAGSSGTANTGGGGGGGGQGGPVGGSGGSGIVIIRYRFQ